MKVIVAGMPKTGTKSMTAALTHFGLKVYDHLENIVLLENEYDKIINEGWTTEDFRQMYEDIDAVVDSPAYYFWEEIHKAFPDSKIILTLRDSEEEWCQSFMKQMEVEDKNIILRLVAIFSPSLRRILLRFRSRFTALLFGLKPQYLLRWRLKINKEMLIKRYKAHNDLVLKNAPPDKLLVMNVKEGWVPLCQFLQVPVPDEPFPHENKGGAVVDDFLHRHPVGKKIRNEALLCMGLFIGSVATCGVLVYKIGPAAMFQSLSSKLAKTLNTVGL